MDNRYVKHFTCWNQLLAMMFGMAKAAPQDKEISGYYRECCQNPNLIGNYSLLPRCYRTTLFAT